MIKSPAIKLSPPPSLEMHDAVRQHIHRKAEIQKNKAKYTLTERDGSLLVTHALEVQFQDGQTIVEAGHIITNVFRIKSGQVDIIKNGLPCCHLTQGFFIGDALLVNDDKSTYKMNVSLKANGPVTLLQLDLSFIKTLFSLDNSLAMKFYHLLATKSASIFHQLVVSLNTPALLSSSLELDNSTNSDTASDTTTTTDQLSTTPPQSACVNLVRSQSQTSVVRRNLKRISRNHFTNDAYKVYQLMSSKHGIQSIRVKPKKLKIVTRSFGFVHKVSIEFARLNTITKVGDNGATIVYNGRKVNTIFFKNQHDLEEFMYLVASLTTPTDQTAPVMANRPISSPTTDEEEDEEDGQVTKEEDHFKGVQTEVELKKGDKVFEEGDLFQRVYTLVSGTLAVYQNGVFLHNLSEGLVFGVDTILFLRPAPVTIEVVSETAELLVIPAYKMHELIDSDVSVALRLFKRAAQILDSQIGKILRVEQQIQGEVSRKSMELARSRSAVDVARRSQELERSSTSSQSMGLIHSASSYDIAHKQDPIQSSSQEFAHKMDGGYTRSAAQEIVRRTQELENASSQEISRMSPPGDLHNSQSQEIARLPQDNGYNNSPSPIPAESKSRGVDSQGVVSPSQMIVGGAGGL